LAATARILIEAGLSGPIELLGVLSSLAMFYSLVRCCNLLPIIASLLHAVNPGLKQANIASEGPI